MFLVLTSDVATEFSVIISKTNTRAASIAYFPTLTTVVRGMWRVSSGHGGTAAAHPLSRRAPPPCCCQWRNPPQPAKGPTLSPVFIYRLWCELHCCCSEYWLLTMMFCCSKGRRGEGTPTGRYCWSSWGSGPQSSCWAAWCTGCGASTSAGRCRWLRRRQPWWGRAGPGPPSPSRHNTTLSYWRTNDKASWLLNFKPQKCLWWKQCKGNGNKCFYKKIDLTENWNSVSALLTCQYLHLF